jgi:hypothetical protein
VSPYDGDPGLDPLALMSPEEVAWRDEQNAVAAAAEMESARAEWDALSADAAAEREQERIDRLSDQIIAGVLDSYHREREAQGLSPWP